MGAFNVTLGWKEIRACVSALIRFFKKARFAFIASRPASHKLQFAFHEDKLVWKP